MQIIMRIFIFVIILYCINIMCGLCPPGKHGVNCRYNCTYRHCFCSSERACDGCEDGYWNRSQNCLLPCISLTCRCTNHTNCLSCKDGSYGFETKCDRKCFSGCDSNTCDNNGMCFSCKPNFTGNKCDSCVDGMYGVNCSLQCSQGCEGYTCNSRDGICNCSKSYTGEKCESCVEGRYGINCSKPCSPGCVHDNCSSMNGNCECREYYQGDTCAVCVDGRYGDHCLNKLEKNEQTDKQDVGATVGGVVGAVLIVVSVVVISIILKRRHLACCMKPRDEGQARGGDFHTPQTVVFAAIQTNEQERHYQQLSDRPNMAAVLQDQTYTELQINNTEYEFVNI